MEYTIEEKGILDLMGRTDFRNLSKGDVIGQKPDSPLAELTMEEHRGAGNDTILHDKTKETEIDRNEFGKERREHWKDRVNVMEGAE